MPDSNFSQDVYARNLISQRGYPLWTPEPNIELPESYQREGLKIGDLGVVVPEEGSFDLFFNINLPHNHQLHANNGVPDHFTPLTLSDDDYKTVPNAEGAGRIIATPSVKWTLNCVDPYLVAGRPRRLTDHQFSMSPREGAVLILPQGADRHRLAKELLFLDYVIQHAVARSWALASFQDSGDFRARCEVVQLERGGSFVPEASTWEALGPLDWRIGPQNYIGNPNQTVFITGFKIAVNEELLHLKRVTVRSDHPQQVLASRLVGLGSTVANLFLGDPRSEDAQSQDNNSQREAPSHPTTPGHAVGAQFNMDGITVERIPSISSISQVHHPSDIINRYLFKKVPSAKIAVVHDNVWIALLERGLLKPEELWQEERLEKEVSEHFDIVTNQDAVYLQSVGPNEMIDPVNVPACLPGNPRRQSEVSVSSTPPPYAPRWRQSQASSSSPPYKPHRHQSDAPSLPPSYEAGRNHAQNVLIVGEIGSGKSSLINVIAGEPLAAVPSDTSGDYPMDAPSYDTVLSDTQGFNHRIRLFDTAGLNEPQLRKSSYLAMIEKANTLIFHLRRTGGICLLIFCIRGGRITASMQNNYRLFCDILCQNEVPVAFVITGLENEDPMEAWWEKNVSAFEAYQLSCSSHACVTATRGRSDLYAERYHESQIVIRAMLLKHVSREKGSWKPERMDWFVYVAGRTLRWLMQMQDSASSRRKALTLEELARHLQHRCNYSRTEAQSVAEKIWVQQQEKVGPDFTMNDSTDEVSATSSESKMSTISSSRTRASRVANFFIPFL